MPAVQPVMSSLIFHFSLLLTLKSQSHQVTIWFLDFTTQSLDLHFLVIKTNHYLPCI